MVNWPFFGGNRERSQRPSGGKDFTNPFCRDTILTLPIRAGKENPMKEILKKIQTILESPIGEQPDHPWNPDAIDAQMEGEFGELYTDLYVLIRNINDYFAEGANPKALDLVDSFLLESIVLLKKNHDIIRVESGDDYVKATAYTPDGESAGYVFDSAVQVNTILELYNRTLGENGMPRMEAGIGLATFPANDLGEEGECECEEGEECHCGEEGHDCGCHEESALSALEFAYATDFSNTAMELASIANSADLDPIVLNESLYSLMSDSEQLKDFLAQNLEKVIFEGENVSVFHGNIVSDEE